MHTNSSVFCSYTMWLIVLAMEEDAILYKYQYQSGVSYYIIKPRTHYYFPLELSPVTPNKKLTVSVVYSTLNLVMTNYSVHLVFRVQYIKLNRVNNNNS